MPCWRRKIKKSRRQIAREEGTIVERLCSVIPIIGMEISYRGIVAFDVLSMRGITLHMQKASGRADQ
jgi:hypothetical protein